jgi:hypothetical protein
MHRQKRNLPCVPVAHDYFQLRRANSESRFRLPAAPSSVLTANSNMDDESDLLEIDLNDPTGSLNRAARSKTESELMHSYDRADHFQSHYKTIQFPSVNDIFPSTKQGKQLRDQTTNTPPISSLNVGLKTKKKLKKKGSSSPNSQSISSTYVDGSMTPAGLSPTRNNPPCLILSSSSSTTTSTTNTCNRAKLQKVRQFRRSYVEFDLVTIESLRRVQALKFPIHFPCQN